MPDIHWPFPDCVPTLRSSTIHVWCAFLDQPGIVRDQLGKALSEDECNRARQFRFDRDRHRYIVGRGVLRDILGRYLGLPAEMLKFEYGDFGKPRLASASGHRAIRFNVAHSDALAVYAVSLGHEVGVDVERVRPIPELLSIAKQFFSPREYAALLALPDNSREDAFFNCWTRKEAYLKAGGQGLSEPLDQFDVSIDDKAELLAVRNASEEPRQWELTALVPAPGYKAALAVRAFGLEVYCWGWPSR